MLTDFAELFSKLKTITKKIINQLEKDFPSFDEAEFFQVFGRKLQDNLSAQGKNTYALGLDPDALTMVHKEVSEKFNQDYKESLAIAKANILQNFDPVLTANYAKKQLKIKLEASEKLLLQKLNTELATKGQEFTNPADKKELTTAFINYLNQIEKKYETSLSRIESVGSLLAKFQLHLGNEESKLKAQDPSATFSITETDLDKLSIGDAPAPVTGFRVHKDNLSEQIMHTLANKKDGEKINIELTVPDRNAISTQIGEIGLQYRNPAVALLFLLVFYFVAMLLNNDEKRVVNAIKKVIEEKGILINPNDTTLTTKRLHNNGKSTVIRKKAALNPEQIKELQHIIQKFREELKAQNQPKEKDLHKFGYESDAGYGSGSDDEESVLPRSPRP